MKKLSLNLEALRVETFDPSPAGRGQRGTVKGHATDWNCPTDPYPTGGGSCIIKSCAYSCDTCDWACPGTGQETVYDPSCGGTCDGEVTCFQSVCIDF